MTSERSSVLRFHLSNTDPVELGDLARCLAALGNEYVRNAQRMGSSIRSEDVRLVIKEVRSGSIEIDLIQLGVVAGVAIAENANTIIDFAKNLKAGMDWLIEKKGSKPEPMASRASLKNYHDILDPVAKDKNGVMVIAPVQIHGSVQNMTVNVTTVYANAGQNAADHAMAEMKEPIAAMHEKVLLRWFQTRNDPASKTGDMAIVESLSEDPVKTLFLSESTKVRMLAMESNIFLKAFVVDVQVETVRGRPKLYVIHNIHDTVVVE